MIFLVKLPLFRPDTSVASISLYIAVALADNNEWNEVTEILIHHLIRFYT
jgi:hypothetical protein